MKKILFCASTVSHINNFHLPYLKAFRDMGYEVHVVTNVTVPIKWAHQVFALPFDKKMHSPNNLRAIIKAFKLLDVQSYEKIITNATLAGAVMRIAAMFLKSRPRIYHISHGYLFNLNSGIKKYIYLIPEKIVARVSDIVMVMNHEDHEIAKRYKLFKESLHYIDGMGVNPSRCKSVSPHEKSELRKQMGFLPDDFLFVYAAEFSKRKNHNLLINAFAKCKLERAHLVLAGDGRTLEDCRKLAKEIGMSNNIHFLGYVNDVPALYTKCDVAVSTSLIEGLPFNIIEAMGCRLPVVVSEIKGHRELVEENTNGLLFQSQDEKGLISCLKSIYTCSQEQRIHYGQIGFEKSKMFQLDHVFDQIMEIYTTFN
ncbi:glycosyltransferase [Desulfosporosinus sp. SB140]|uniref:glycosyltransferase n=1 Tax=Desulfosporosinus paludis TaxID=3115649 RepID=UPI003890EBA7